MKELDPHTFLMFKQVGVYVLEDEVAVYENEVDIHLSHKIGLDWMVKGQQKEVLTPGQNEKQNDTWPERGMPKRVN